MRKQEQAKAFLFIRRAMECVDDGYHNDVYGYLVKASNVIFNELIADERDFVIDQLIKKIEES